MKALGVAGGFFLSKRGGPPNPEPPLQAGR